MEFACEAFATADDLIAADCQCGELDPDEVTAALEDASDLLAFLSNGKVAGRCQTTLRPCREAACGWWWVHSWPYDTVWNCCCGVDTIPLATPIVSVDLITIDGDVLPSGDFKVINGRELVRTDGGIWPGCQNVTEPSSADGTFAITYTFGFRPIFAKMAAIELGCSLLTGIKIPGRQRLPGNTTFASHQGVQTGFATRAGAVVDLAIELPFVQQFLALYGPDSGPGRGTAYAPEMYEGWTFHTE